MEEIWKDIKGYEGRYQVSNTGKVKSLTREWVFGNTNSVQRKEETIVTQYVNKYKYCCVLLSTNSKKKSIKVHRLVAIAFIPNPENKPQVNHKDGDKQNNNDWNLEWNTAKENVKHAYDTGLKNGSAGVKNGRVKLTEKDVIEIRRLSSTMSGYAIAKKYGIYQTTVSKILTRKLWKHI